MYLINLFVQQQRICFHFIPHHLTVRIIHYMEDFFFIDKFRKHLSIIEFPWQNLYLSPDLCIPIQMKNNIAL